MKHSSLCLIYYVKGDREALQKLSNWAIEYPRGQFSASFMLYWIQSNTSMEVIRLLNESNLAHQTTLAVTKWWSILFQLIDLLIRTRI